MSSFDFPRRTHGEAKHESTMTVWQCGCFAEDWLKSDNRWLTCTRADGHDASADGKLVDE